MSAANIYDKKSIVHELDEKVNAFIRYINEMDKTAFDFAPPGKWTAGQHLDHLIRSIKPLNLAYYMPLAVLKMLFGSANRPSRTYQGLVERYHQKLSAGGRARGRFIPSDVDWADKEKLVKQYQYQKEKLTKRVNLLKEENLDKYILPHPLLGKLTLREMLFFTIYHNEHHLALVKNYREMGKD